MRLIEIDNMEYDRYNSLRNILFKHVPYAIVNAEFCNGNGYFFFWDESYIPKELEKYIKRPLGNSKQVIACSEEIKGLL